MGSLFSILFILLLLTQPKDARKSELNKYLVGALVGAAIISAILPLIGIILGITVAGGLSYYLYKKWQQKQRAEERKRDYGFGPERWRTFAGNHQGAESRHTFRGDYQESGFSYGNAAGNPGSMSLPRSAKERRRIVETFNLKYTLCLTDEQIQSIVNSSYLSDVWKRELEAMNRTYETVHQWFQGPTNWLRIYMHAYHIQEITSDIRQQEEIVMYTYETLFSYVDTLDDMTLSQKIASANNYFMTSFDDISFMAAYRYMEAKGMKHTLGHTKVLRNEDPVENLVRKYET